MYAIISCGGKQYRVQPNDKIRVEKINAKEGDMIEINKIHLVSSGEQIIVEPEKLGSFSVTAQVLSHGKTKKIRVFKYKRRKNYHRTYGHRQLFTELLVKEIKG
ncbi:MAG TPA: 50S ribosomal protein L21 [Candidatus Hydrogenedens sp.]|nr:50S ribosomal protein L21 [Candidatus Hydrogenedens sp.]HOK08613.1 50S ribosomal protein L21 [Candidatus Hydrogenedens sp.]HOL19905.1 50S ribosomal protein L21 [Candidatus Hydrogenedens sp.]HPP58346.1 50S ribosomal protein L21 [Candidatus Hydrogenedens sp.]